MGASSTQCCLPVIPVYPSHECGRHLEGFCVDSAATVLPAVPTGSPVCAQGRASRRSSAEQRSEMPSTCPRLPGARFLLLLHCHKTSVSRPSAILSLHLSVTPYSHPGLPSGRTVRKRHKSMHPERRIQELVKMCYMLNCHPPKFTCCSPSPNTSEQDCIGDGAFRAATKIKRGP